MTAASLASFAPAPRPSRSRRAASVNASRARRRLVSAYEPDGPRRATGLVFPLITEWRINGHPALVLHWPAEDWARLDEKPAAAQPNGDGSWTELRIA